MTINYALSCAKGSFKYMRNNEIRDTFTKVMYYVSNDVEVEPSFWLLESKNFYSKFTGTDEYGIECTIQSMQSAYDVHEKESMSLIDVKKSSNAS